MKVKTIAKLNKRLWPSTRNTPLPNPHLPNDIIEVESEVEGEAPPSTTNNKWYKTSQGYYVWSGGVTLTEDVKEIASYDAFINRFSGDGSNVGIALLDSGVNENHVFLKNHIKYYESFLPSKSKLNITSHGNRVAGILASSDTSVQRNKSDLYCFRVSDTSVKSKAVSDALEEINNSMSVKIDIINMSIDILYEDAAKLQPIINSLYDKGIIIVVAGGENNVLNNTSLLTNVIKSASFNAAKFDSVIKKNGLNTHYSSSFLNVPISSYSLSGNALDTIIHQDSAYCAVISSVLARWISASSKQKSPLRNINAQAFLDSISQPIKSINIPKPFIPYI